MYKTMYKVLLMSINSYRWWHIYATNPKTKAAATYLRLLAILFFIYYYIIVYHDVASQASLTLSLNSRVMTSKRFPYY